MCRSPVHLHSARDWLRSDDIIEDLMTAKGGKTFLKKGLNIVNN